MSLALCRCEAGDVVRVSIDGELSTVRLGFRFQHGGWLARTVEVADGLIRDRSEPFVLRDEAPVLERLVDRAWYAHRGRGGGAAETTDPLLRGIS